MTIITAALRPLVLIASVGVGAIALAAGPALVAKPIKITMPASVFKDETSRVCMPRTVLGRTVDKTLPATICETRNAWAERGVEIVTK